MNNQRTPEKRKYSLRKRLKTENTEESTSSEVKEENTRQIKQICDFIAENKPNLISNIEFSDSIRLMTLQAEITEIIESHLFKGMCEKSPSIHDRILHETIRKNDRSLLMKLINYGLVQSSTCTHEIPPLFEIVALQRFRWVESFHKAGVSFANQRTKSGKPLLHFALEQRGISKNFVKKLLFFGVELSAFGPFSNTPLHHLLSSNNVPMSNREKEKFVKLFLKFGANASLPTPLGINTPLHLAIDSKNLPALQQLLLYGADVNLKNLQGQTPFKLAAQSHTNFVDDNMERICRTLVKHINWQELKGKHVDETSSKERRIIRQFKHTKIVNKTKKTQERNALAILLWDENKLAQHYRTGEQLDVSKVIRNRPYKYWKRILKFRIKKSRQRIVLVNECEKLLMQFFRLPSVFVREMLTFLTTTDLRSLYAALCPRSFLKKLNIESVKLSDNDDDDDSTDEYGLDGSDVSDDESDTASNESDDSSMNEISDEDWTDIDDTSSDEMDENLLPLWFLL